MPENNMPKMKTDIYGRFTLCPAHALYTYCDDYELLPLTYEESVSLQR